MRKRAEDVERTRQRIVDAAVDLHGTAGPASTGIAAVAERAGVTRPTRRRHPNRPSTGASRTGRRCSRRARALAVAAEAAPPRGVGRDREPP
ncbi:TetR family transcriptional regulator [Kitasatospora sp. CB02891]|uniref:TetR family transcriptional regulator n=1 Tax=Kitasatospora sp. CB02891 TaxID=2020329 RepID=UPI000C26F2FD